MVKTKTVIWGMSVLLEVSLLSCAVITKEQKSNDFEGKQVYRMKCIACHRLLPPEQHQYEILEKYVTRYGKNLSINERETLLRYFRGTAKSEK
ncbi:MAG: hypothetical protein QME64_00265 [bacterium]|nr:hypothetical protein [bacterium]